MCPCGKDRDGGYRVNKFEQVGRTGYQVNTFEQVQGLIGEQV